MLCQQEIFSINLQALTRNLSPIVLAVCVLPLPLSAVGEASIGKSLKDPRRVYSQTSPGWLRAVGKLNVPSIKIVEGHRSNHREDCSATLVSKPGEKTANTIVTAWHCLEFYTDLSKSITFTLLPDSPDPISAQVYRLADGGSMHADWAILRLHNPVATKHVLALPIHPTRASMDQRISMAGYSSDSGLGQDGRILTYDADCSVTLQIQNSSNSNCRAFRGASGGAVVQLSAEGEPWLSGVISQGNGAELSTFIPVARFRSALNQHLRQN